MATGTAVFSFSGKRVLFVDTAKAKYVGLTNRLTKDGIVCDSTGDSSGFLSKLRDEHFDLCILNLMVAGMGPNELISSVRTNTRNRDLKVVILTKQVHTLNIRNAIRAGANDFIVDPFEEEGVYHRIHYHLTPKRIIDLDSLTDDGSAVPNEYTRLILDSIEALSHAKKDAEQAAFVKVIQRVAAVAGSNRTSLIIVDSASNSGLVLASSDDPNFCDFQISLTKYPEILHVMSTGQFVCVSDVNTNQLTNQISQKIKDIPVGSMMVFPVLFRDEVIGVLSVRRPERSEIPAAMELKALQALANTLAAYSNIRASLRKLYKEFAKPASRVG